jgi:hypothetical protein
MAHPRPKVKRKASQKARNEVKSVAVPLGQLSTIPKTVLTRSSPIELDPAKKYSYVVKELKYSATICASLFLLLVVLCFIFR